MTHLLKKLVFWGIVFLVLKHSFKVARELVETFGTTSRVAVTATNMQRIDSALQREKLMEQDTYPRDFSAFMERSFHGDSVRNGLDNWGQPLMYEPYRNGYMLASSGPDRQFGTYDDLSIVRQGETATTRLYPSPTRRAAASVNIGLTLTHIKQRLTRVATKVRTALYRLRTEVKKARYEQTLKRVQQR